MQLFNKLLHFRCNLVSAIGSMCLLQMNRNGIHRALAVNQADDLTGCSFKA